MIRLDAKHLLFIEPPGPASAQPVLDELTCVVAGVLRGHTKRDVPYMGVHTCVCGAQSGAADLLLQPNGGRTNTLAVHYLAHHRDQIPASEMAKVRGFVAAWLMVYPDLRKIVPTAEELRP